MFPSSDEPPPRPALAHAHRADADCAGCLHVVKDEYAPVSYERVNVVHSWLLELVSHRQM